MQYVKVEKDGGSVIRRKVRFFVEIKESGARYPCINADQVKDTLKAQLGVDFSTSDIYDWTNMNRNAVKSERDGRWV